MEESLGCVPLHTGKEGVIEWINKNGAYTYKWITDLIGYLSVRLTPGNVIASYETLAIPYAPWEEHLASAIRTLYVDAPAQGQGDARSQKTFFEHVAAIVSLLPKLEHVYISGSIKVEARAVTDFLQLFRGSLQTVHCTPDALLVSSWSSLRRSERLKDFRGFFGMRDAPPNGISPSIMPNLKYLETSAPFFARLSSPCKITHLSLYLTCAQIPAVLNKVSNLLGGQLLSLRLHRLFEDSPNSQNNRAVSQSNPLWASHSPLVVCGLLRTPRLTYLDIRDASAKPKELIRVERASRNSLRLPQTTGLPCLKRLVWHPVWGTKACKMPEIVDEWTSNFFISLPGTIFVAILVDDADTGMWRVSSRSPGSSRLEANWQEYAINDKSWKITELEHETEGSRKYRIV